MAARNAYPTGVDVLAETWANGGTYEAMLLDVGWSPDPANDVFVADISANEYAAGGYSRQTLANLTRSVVLPAAGADPGYVVFDCDNPSFGVMTGDVIATWLAVYAFVTNDADSPLVVSFQCFYAADGVTSCDFTVSTDGFYRLSTVCPNDFS